jgi:hypothetical protein
VRDVQLLIRYTWLWYNETKPGKDDPGTSTYYTLPKEIAPGARLPFSFKTVATVTPSYGRSFRNFGRHRRICRSDSANSITAGADLAHPCFTGMRPSEALALSWVMSISTANRFQFLKAVILDLKPLRKPQPANARSKSLPKLQRS